MNIGGCIIHNDARLIYFKETVTVEGAGHFSLTYKYPIGLGVSDTKTYVLLWHYTNFCRGYIVDNGDSTINIIPKGTSMNVSYFYDPSLQ